MLEFFKEDFSEVVGAYYDGEKISLARYLNGTKEFDEVSCAFDEDVSKIEQLAEKIFVVCAKRGWRTSKMGFCLREGTATTFQTILGVPAKEIDNAVKAWALAHVGKDALFNSIQHDGEIWMQAISRATAFEFVKAWKKNSMNLCVLTAMPETIDATLTPADFVADVVAHAKTPNLIEDRRHILNYKKISAAILAIFFCALIATSAKLYAEYQRASAQLENSQAELKLYQEEIAIKKLFEIQVAELHAINDACAAQNSKPIFPALVKLGTIADGKTFLTKIKSSNDALEIEGTTENPTELESYSRRLKKFLTHDVHTESLSQTDEGTTFSMRLRNF